MYDIRHCSTYDIRHTTYDIRHTTYNIQHTTYNRLQEGSRKLEKVGEGREGREGSSELEKVGEGWRKLSNVDLCIEKVRSPTGNSVCVCVCFFFFRSLAPRQPACPVDGRQSEWPSQTGSRSKRSQRPCRRQRSTPAIRPSSRASGGRRCRPSTAPNQWT